MKESDQRGLVRRTRAGASGRPSARGACSPPRRFGHGARDGATCGRASSRRWSALFERVVVAWAGAVLACSPQSASPVAETLDPEAFVETYVALRLAALQSPSGVVSEGERDRVLAEHGTSAEALLAFVERHGRDLVFMEEVWDDAQKAIREVQDGWTAR